MAGDTGARGRVCYTGNHSSEFMQQVTTRRSWAWFKVSRAHRLGRAPESDEYGDCLAMLRALAAAEGISSGGEVTGAKRQRKTFSQADYGRP